MTDRGAEDDRYLRDPSTLEIVLIPVPVFNLLQNNNNVNVYINKQKIDVHKIIRRIDNNR